MLSHGWDGRASQFSVLARDLIAEGYRVVSFDAPAHGASAGRRTYLVDWLDGAGMWQTIFVDSPTSTKHECGVPAVTCSYRVTPTGAGGYGPATSVTVVTQTTPGVPTGPPRPGAGTPAYRMLPPQVGENVPGPQMPTPF